MDIRNDIYPPTPETKIYLQTLTTRTQEAYPTVFQTADDVIRYVNNFRSPKLAGLFLDIGNYYSAMTYCSCPACGKQQTQVCQVCSSRIEASPFTFLIMALSVMEKLATVESSGVESWVDFSDWVSRKDVEEEYAQVLRKGKFRDFSALMESLKGRWSKEFGGLTKTTNFLRASLSAEEKLTLIKSIRFLQAAPELPARNFAGDEEIKSYVKSNGDKTRQAGLPSCFEPRQYWKCYAKTSVQGYCADKSSCPLAADKDRLDKFFKESVKTLYDWRNRFIHDLKLPPVREGAFYGVHYRGSLTVAELKVAMFKPVLEGLIKKFFDKYQIQNSVTSKHAKKSR
ncbi:hypothetical protein GX563_03620 [Candidatus Bathyarchaeota archaeon]|nr:hypothetical protein [Candidatus Bathyarchaeota archaeon]